MGYDQLELVQACVCVWSVSVHTSGCSFACRQRGRSSAKTQTLAQCTFNPLTPTVANLQQTPSIQTAGEIACVFPQCLFVHIRYIPRNILHALVYRRSGRSGNYIRFTEANILFCKIRISSAQMWRNFPK